MDVIEYLSHTAIGRTSVEDWLVIGVVAFFCTAISTVSNSIYRGKSFWSIQIVYKCIYILKNTSI